MQCLILAGGLGTRMKNIAGDTPKALLPVGDKTYIDVQLQWLKLLGVSDVVMALGNGGEEIKNHIEEKQTHPSYPQVNYSFDGPTLLGTGGAIRHAAPMLSKDFIVTYGDTFLSVNIKRFIQTHVASQKSITISILKNQNVGDKSNIIYKNGTLVKYDKFNIEPEMDYIDYGMSLVKKESFLKFAPVGKFDFASYMSSCVEKKDAAAFEAKDLFLEVGSPQGYIDFKKALGAKDFDLKKLALERGLLS